MTDAVPFNPLDKQNLGASVAQALLGRKARPLGDLPLFAGAGIYALYYRGTHGAYVALSAANPANDPQAPIYVGKAIPPGGRKGSALTETAATTALWRRLKEHAESIQCAEDLDLKDFVCRSLVVDDIWIPLGEALLIAKFSPIWNQTVDGFGNHDPGKGRYNGMRSRWDTLHPGRPWALRCQPRPETAEQIMGEVKARLVQEPSLIRSQFLAEQRIGRYAVGLQDEDGNSP